MKPPLYEGTSHVLSLAAATLLRTLTEAFGTLTIVLILPAIAQIFDREMLNIPIIDFPLNPYYFYVFHLSLPVLSPIDATAV